MTLNEKIRNLNPGEEVEISRTDAGYCTVERSGDGKTLRYIRYIGNSWEVFHKSAY